MRVVTGTRLLISAGAGLLLAALYAASPLSVCAGAAGIVLWRLAGNDLPADERRLLQALVAMALGARLALVAATLLAGLPHLNDLSVGALSGDEAYYLGRALRARDILLGFTDGRYDYFVATDEYGRTSYLTLLTWIQVTFGPTPYGMRLVNALLFTGGGLMLFGLARPAFGALPAFLALAITLFLPSLFVASVSLLKESLYFFVSALLVTCAVRTLRSPRAATWALTVPGLAASLWLLNDLRRGALVLAASGLALGLLIRGVAGSPRRLALVSAAGVLAVAVVAGRADLRSRAVDGIEAAAKTHAGHVFTVGHAYKLMDPGFYVKPEAPMAWDLRLTGIQAARFLARAAASFIVTPWPWQLASKSELAFLPEHLLWYVIIALLPVGIVAGWRRDPLLTSLLVGLAVPTAAALAVTNGNVGTLLRLRGLVTPYLVWLSAVGACAIGEALASNRWRASAPLPLQGGAA